MIEHALEHLPLVMLISCLSRMLETWSCPTDFELGAEKRIVVVSATEGDDVVNKHPMMFRGFTYCVLNKIDLAEAVGADLNWMEQDVLRYNLAMKIFKTNMKTGEGIDSLVDEILS